MVFVRQPDLRVPEKRPENTDARAASLPTVDVRSLQIPAEVAAHVREIREYQEKTRGANFGTYAAPDRRAEIMAAAAKARAEMAPAAREAFSQRVVAALRRAQAESDRFKKSLRLPAEVWNRQITF